MMCSYHSYINDNIVIRPAHKGSGIVVFDKVKNIGSLQKEME